MKKSIEDRFWEKVDVRGPDDCWEWLGGKVVDGYGTIYFNRQPWRTHRLVWWISNGSIPDDLCVLHKCDNRACVNLSHLFLGTRLDNNLDMVAKGRQAFSNGEKNGNSKLSNADVINIRAIYKYTYATQRQLAKIYSIGVWQMSKIINQHSWFHI